MGVTPRNSFSQETTTQDNGRLQQRKTTFITSLCANSEGTPTISLKSQKK